MCSFSFFQTIHIFNITTRTDFARTDLRYWSLHNCERLIDNDFGFAFRAYWYTFFISTRMCIPLSIHIRPPCRWIQRQKIAPRKRAKLGRARVRARVRGIASDPAGRWFFPHAMKRGCVITRDRYSIRGF